MRFWIALALLEAAAIQDPDERLRQAYAKLAKGAGLGVQLLAAGAPDCRRP